MATETIKVKQLAKFSVVTESGEYINWDKTCPDSEKGTVVGGGEYEMEIERTESGKGRILSVKKTNVTAAPTIVAPVFNNTPVVEPIKETVKQLAKMAGADTYTGKTDWAAKDRSMMIGGMSHDAAVLAAAAATANVPLESLLSDYNKALGEMLRLREAIK